MFIATVLVLGVIIVSAVFPHWWQDPTGGPPNWWESLIGRNEDYIIEKAMILDVSFNNTILVKVEALSSSESGSIIFNYALVRDRDYNLVARCVPVPSEVPVGTTMTLDVNLDSALTAGNYTVILWSETGFSCVSPSFTVP
jgi:hypothetical protein